MRSETHIRSLLTAAAAFIAGCGASTWERTFSPTGAPAPSLAQDAPIRIRDVPWERIQSALVDLEKERAQSDSPPDEWPQDKKDAAKAKLLKVLQVTADPSTVEVLGRSVFRTTDRTDPNDGQLTAFARKIGATTVVWSSNYLGRTQVVRDEPVNEWRTETRWNSRRGRSETITENSTIWVPVVLQADEHAFMAYFLKEAGPR